MDKRFFKGMVEKADNGILSVAVASDSSVDRDGDIVDPNGIDTGNFEKNPVLLYGHDYRSEPIGKVLNLVKESNRLMFSAQFAVDISERAKQIFQLYEQKFLNAFSIGFIPRKWEDTQNADGSTVRTFTESELLEISAVPVPANPNAIALVRTMKSIDEQIVRDMEKFQQKSDEDGDEEDLDDIEPDDEDLRDIEKRVKETKERTEKNETDIASLAGRVAELETGLATIGEKATSAEAARVEELLRHPAFYRGVLTSVDKALGKTLKRMRR